MSREVRIAPIVEGHGEVEAVPILIRRIAGDLDPGLTPHVLTPIKVSFPRILKEGEIERATDLAARKLGGAGGIVVIMDCDWKGACPAREGPRLLRRVREARGDMPVALVLAKKEFEAWFLAAAESLRGKGGLPWDLDPPGSPEAIRGAKEWLTRMMPAGRTYSETTDQPRFTAAFDMQAARKADSFDKCYREISSLLKMLRRGR